MRERVEERLRALARRAGVSSVPPAAVAAAGVVFALAVVAAAWVWWPRGAPDAEFPTSGSAGASSSASRTAQAGGSSGHSAEATTVDPSAVESACVVHVVGAVRHPGVYELRPGQRIIDAVQAAGGLLGDAAQAGINMAQVLQDGEQVVVPTTDQLEKGGAVPSAGAGVGTGSGGAATSGTSAGQAGGAPVNLNTADATLLDTLPGVGPATAARIVADRAANGPFKSPDDLGRVPGIGPKKLDQLKALVCVR